MRKPEQNTARRQALTKRYRNSLGIQSSIHYPPVHQFSDYRQRYPHLSVPITEAVAAREVTLPLYPSMQEGAVDRVIEAVAIGYARRCIPSLNRIENGNYPPC